MLEKIDLDVSICVQLLKANEFKSNKLFELLLRLHITFKESENVYNCAVPFQIHI